MARSHVHVCLRATCLHVSVVLLALGEFMVKAVKHVILVPGSVSPENGVKNKRDEQTMSIQVVHRFKFNIPTAPEHQAIAGKLGLKP